MNYLLLFLFSLLLTCNRTYAEPKTVAVEDLATRYDAFILDVSAQEAGHLASGTQYGKEGVSAYEANRHGLDGARFLDPYFTPYLMNAHGLEVLDAGCGTAPWAIYAAQNGANVLALDLQEEMIAAAKRNVESSGLSGRINLIVADVADLPCKDGSFDLAISINVGCNLPSTVEIDGKNVGLGPHIREMARSLKPGGIAVVTAPASFATVFTDGTSHSSVVEHIRTILTQLPENPSPTEIRSHLNGLKEVYRATFVIRDGRLSLVVDESDLQNGEPIWRKLPGLTVPNRYHPEEEYLEEFLNAGLTVRKVDHPQFGSKAEVAEHFGEEYAEHSPFAIYSLVKE